jgi:WD40 repeat protein
MEAEPEVIQVQCLFKTNIQNPDFQAPEDIITLQSNMTRKMLTKMIHGLLENAIPEKTKFEFLINGQMLREDLGSMMKVQNLSNDETIEIVYTFAMHKPKEDEKIENDEWINVIKSSFRFDDNIDAGLFAVGFFNGSVKLYDENCSLLYNKNLHEDTVNDLIFNKDGKKKYTLITAGEDEEIGVHKLKRSKDEIEDVRVANIAQQANCLSFCPTNSDMLTFAGNDGLVKLVDISPEVLERNQEIELKKHKRAKTTVAFLRPTSKIEGNKHPINCMNWINNSEIVTGGYDHAIRVFNVDKEEHSHSVFTNNKGVTCIDSIKDNILAGSEDHVIRLWDIRSKSTDPVKQFRGHNGWVSTVKLNPTSDYHFISSGYDSRTLVWDFRCDQPLYKIGLSPAEKIFASDWNSSDRIISGGDTGTLQIHMVK